LDERVWVKAQEMYDVSNPCKETGQGVGLGDSKYLWDGACPDVWRRMTNVR